ncbi:hypothetical protein [Gallaecimonas pentaromativorans]|uniref:YKOF-related protein n=1 Tax=Gallaecimonas pentaromativorans TaxID=584787 RepID=A0A3N1P5P6_9GAMM|nr:hypothetical protein [Gallaecimonas pentaromativorans]MED5525602.1 hypothetical protein [Pseudomonadota bacterium]ROQ27364.1 YKOF-related protein [Gallaecimonas pentaromativorans]
MNLSVEISMYPLADDYIPPIQGFIDTLNRHPQLTVLTNTMSTQVFGPYDTVLKVVGEAMKAFHAEGKASFVCKFLGGDLRP